MKKKKHIVYSLFENKKQNTDLRKHVISIALREARLQSTEQILV